MRGRLRATFFFLLLWVVTGSGLLLWESGSSAPLRSAPEEAQQLAGQPLGDYRARRERLMELAKDGIVVLSGAVEEEFGEVERFRQRNYFLYLTGVDVPRALLILAAMESNGPREILFLPPRNPARERWTGPKIGPGEVAERTFRVQRALSTGEFEAELKRLAEKTRILYTVVPRGPSARFRWEQEFIERLRQIVPDADIRDVTPLIDEMRRVKSPAEIAVLKEAVRITGEAHADVMAALRPGLYEYHLEALVMAAFLRNGAMRAGFPSIIGSGPNSTILHYMENSRQIGENELVVVDIGAEYKYYTADITRTLPSSGRFTERQRQIYELVLGAQKAAEAAFRVGRTTIRDLHRAAIEFMRASPLRSSDGQTLDRYFIHGLGHYLGMDVHDVGDYSKPLTPGVVFTIEPGIYLPAENLGVRIEDDYLVTETGLVKLSAHIPSSPDEIEKLVGRNKPIAR